MYRTSYSLPRMPFEMSPDPYFFYPTTRHKEALAMLNYAVQEKNGLVVIKETDHPSRTFSRDFKKEAGTRTL